MPKKRLHRVAVYLMDPDRRRIMLERVEVSGHRSQYTVPTRNLSDLETPYETARNLVRELAGTEMNLLSYPDSIPAVLDFQTLRLQAPLFMELIYVDSEKDYVDMVYLGIARKATEFPERGRLGWFNAEDLVGNTAPKYVKRAVRQILRLVHGQN